MRRRSTNGRRRGRPAKMREIDFDQAALWLGVYRVFVSEPTVNRFELVRWVVQQLGGDARALVMKPPATETPATMPEEIADTTSDEQAADITETDEVRAAEALDEVPA